MFYRRLLLSCILAILLVLAVPAYGQSSAWSSYIFNNETKELLQVNADGTTQSYDLGLAADVYVPGTDMAFSNDGSRLAYCIQDYSQTDSPGTPSQLAVRDLNAGTVISTLDMGTGIGCRASLFSGDASQLASGMIHYFPGDPAMENPEIPIWRLRIQDVNSGAVVRELNAQSAAVAAFDVLSSFAIMPVTTALDAAGATFIAMPWGMGGGAVTDAFHWDFASDTVTRVEHVGNQGYDYLPATGETIWLAQDSTLASGNPGGPLSALNVLMYQDASGNPQQLYHSPDWILVNAMFVNDGQSLALVLLESFDTENPAQQATRVMIINRDGTTETLADDVTYSEIKPAPGGFVRFHQQTGADFQPPISYTFDYYSGSTPTTLWSVTYDTQEFGWQIVWTPPVSAASDLPPFTPVG